MFGNIFKRLKVATSGLTDSAIGASEETTMEAVVAGMALAGYANEIMEDEEVDAVNKLITSSPQLKEFRNEPVRLFDAYCDQMEASPLQGRIDLLNKVKQVSGDVTNSERVLIAAITVALASKPDPDTDPLSTEEESVLSEIARSLDLRLGKYI